MFYNKGLLYSDSKPVAVIPRVWVVASGQPRTCCWSEYSLIYISVSVQMRSPPVSLHCVYVISRSHKNIGRPCRGDCRAADFAKNALEIQCCLRKSVSPPCACVPLIMIKKPREAGKARERWRGVRRVNSWLIRHSGKEFTESDEAGTLGGGWAMRLMGIDDCRYFILGVSSHYNILFCSSN